MLVALLGLLIEEPVAMAAEDDVTELQRLMQQSEQPEQRMDATVTSAGRHNQKVAETPAAIYVITQTDIRRSGVTNIPDALRMVPGLDVARIDSNKWAVSSRGFNNRYSNKLLVLMDGREVYNPTFGGVYWEVQDTPLHDIERIEVIRGPGAALWGANAVNGVINIITKTAQETVGGHLSAGVGTYEQNAASFRYGHRFSENTAARVWAKGFNRGAFDTVEGRSGNDSWSQARAGFRLDHDSHDGTVATLLGDAYSTLAHQTLELPSLAPPYAIFPNDRSSYSGFNVLGRWKKALSVTSEISLQGYYDHFYHTDMPPPSEMRSAFVEERDTFDLEFQHRFQWAEAHKLIWGLGYRLLQDRMSSSAFAIWATPRTNKQLFSAFVQDEYTLIDNSLVLTLGAKLQHNDYTGFEGQPNIRLLWTPDPKNTVWAAVSRAVRTPSRVETDASLGVITVPPNSPGNPTSFPVPLNTLGNSAYQSEEVLAYELGYRFKPREDLYLDMALFYNDYKHLRSFDALHPVIQTNPALAAYLPYENLLKGSAYGGEWLLNWKPLERWQLELAYSYINLQYEERLGIFASEMGDHPQQQVSARSSLNLTQDLDFDLWVRYVDRLPYLSRSSDLLGANVPRIPRWLDEIPAYVTLDARLAWRPIKNLELSVVGQNLLDNHHPEFQQEVFSPLRSQVPRSVYVKFDWQF
jgi:iron complex outermembrane receptor protein